MQAEHFGAENRQVIVTGWTPVVESGLRRDAMGQSVCDRKSTDPFQLRQYDYHLSVATTKEKNGVSKT